MAGVETEAAVVRLLNDIETLRRSLRLYPASHPALKPARARIRERAEAVAREVQTASLAFGPGTVSWNDAPLELPANAPASRLVTLLFHASVACVRMAFPEACEGLADLPVALAAMREPPSEAERARFFADAASLAGVEMVAIDLSDVRLMPSDEEAVRRGTRPVWAELARRLSRDGSFPLAGRIRAGELSPGMARDLAEDGDGPDVLFDHLFLHLGEIVRSSPLDRRPVTLQEVREFFDELVFLLTPERRKLAVVAAVRHLPVVGGDDPWIAADLLLDAVEFMLVQEVAVPETVQRAVHALAAPAAGTAEVPEEIAARARLLLARLPVGELADVTENVLPQPPLRLDWAGMPFARELTSELREERVRVGLLTVLEDAVALWPGLPVASRARVRLAEEMASAVEIGDLAGAKRLTRIVVGASDEESRAAVSDAVVPAAVGAFKTYERPHHAELMEILHQLGERALPGVLRALAEEESLAVRKRLLDVVVRHGERAVPHVLPLLDDPRWYVVRNAAFLLRRIASPAAVPALRAHARAAHPKVLSEVLRALVAADDPVWLELLLGALDSSDAETRAVAAEVAGTVSRPEVARAVIERLRPRIGNGLREPFAAALIRALGRLGDPAALEPLQEVLALKQWRYAFSLDAVRREAAVAIAGLPGAAARRQAEALAADRDPAVAAAVQGARRRRSEPEEEDE